MTHMTHTQTLSQQFHCISTGFPAKRIEVIAFPCITLETIITQHTCFNRIELPLYESKEQLKHYVTDAIHMETTGFGME